ncbi:unnamed protein product (macronuclear) [Paramecium tetraurelia]|uniref:Uncharacterized protein n=1 Tax=Paramecium tetraurelia TaxID=5888 RepID=A0DFU7_PARTE|nr:uncharacterized protein GSPATT00039476001 [Paramecium tetraurelia]CAK81914.1 unnamed protein product [Paramecium tetraurelia]|eukprot:XP_001449311.1 hypothetical protein (macronuclear) [Paramecium tetraurelia strain d4-2]
MRKEDQIHLSSLQIWNGMDTPVHQSSNIFSEKFKQSSEFHYNCNQPFCLQHPEKKAKYVLLNAEGPNEKLCTKCAVVFAQQGHKIQLIEEDNAKKKQTDSFIDQLLQTKSEIDNIHSNFLCTEANLKKFYNDQYTQVVKTFGNIENVNLSYFLLCHNNSGQEYSKQINQKYKLNKQIIKQQHILMILRIITKKQCR